MTDDFAGNATTTGFFSLLANANLPLSGLMEQAGDSDWFRVDGFRRWHDYQISVFWPLTGTPAQFVEMEMFDLNSVSEWKSSSLLPVTFMRPDSQQSLRHYQHSGNDGQYFLGINGTFGDTSTTGGYRLYVKELDIAGEDAASAYALNFRTGDFHASVVNRFGDVDWFSYNLFAGVNYVIDLLGAASFVDRSTTLTDPILRLFDAQSQFVKGDNDSGAGNNSRLSFTPTVDGFFCLQVLGNNNTAGSYILSSPQFDDFKGSIATTGLVVPGAGPVSGRVDYYNDVDLFRVELQEGFLYRFIGTDLPISLVDAQGNYAPVNYVDDFTREFTFRRPAGQPATFYVASAAYLSGGTRYSIEVGITDDHGSTFTNNTYWNFSVPSQAGIVEIPLDRDWFRADLVPFGRYTFRVEPVGPTPLSSPAVTLRNLDMAVIGGPTAGTLFYTAPAASAANPFGLVFVDAHSTSVNGTGQYRLFISTDAAAGDQSTAWNVELSGGLGLIANALELPGDVDFHRIRMKANTSYRLDPGLEDSGTFQIVLPSGFVVNYDSFFHSHYYSDGGGDHYIVYRSSLWGGEKGSFKLAITEGYKANTASGFYGWPNPQGLGSFNDVMFLTGSTVEVWSSLPLCAGGTNLLVSPGQAVQMTLDQWKSLRPDPALTNSGEVFARSGRANGYWDSWSSLEIGGRVRLDAIAVENPATLNSPVTWAFAEGLPSYLAGDALAASFAPLTSAQRGAVTQAVDSWKEFYNLVTDRFSLAPAGAGNDGATMMVYMAALNSDVLAVTAGAGKGSDLILNVNSPLMSSLTPGTQGFFEVLRGLGSILGLKSTTTVGRDVSIMGSRTGGTWDTLPWASSPLPADLRGVRPANQIYLHFGVDETPNTYFLGGPTPFYRSIIDAGSPANDTISAAGTSPNATIDLRPGARSWSGAASNSPYSFLNSYFTLLKTGLGGHGNDWLRGNHEDNLLSGKAGNDTLLGGVGDDWLLGGAGDDRYIYKPGWGVDWINEAGLGGTDVLRIEGGPNLTGLADDITFERVGNDLMIRLEMDGEQDLSGSRIGIKNATLASSRVEALTLVNLTGTITRISMQSVIDQLSSPRQRFNVSTSSDQFGFLVTPV